MDVGEWMLAAAELGRRRWQWMLTVKVDTNLVDCRSWDSMLKLDAGIVAIRDSNNYEEICQISLSMVVADSTQVITDFFPLGCSIKIFKSFLEDFKESNDRPRRI